MYSVGPGWTCPPADSFIQETYTLYRVLGARLSTKTGGEGGIRRARPQARKRLPERRPRPSADEGKRQLEFRLAERVGFCESSRKRESACLTTPQAVRSRAQICILK